MLVQSKAEILPTSKANPLRYAFGMFGTSIPINMFKTFAAIYAVDTLHITTKQFSSILLIYTVIDIFNIFFFGYLSDQTRSKWGRRKPWIIGATPVLILSFITFFHLEQFSNQALIFYWLLFFYVLTASSDSLININYGAWFPELFVSATERFKTNIWRQVFQVFAMMISIALTPVVTQAIGYFQTAIIYGVLAWGVIWYMGFGCQEQVAETITKSTLKEMFKTYFSNRAIWKYGLATIFYSVTFTILMQSLPFFVKYYLHRSEHLLTFLLFTILCTSVIGLIAVNRFLQKVHFIDSWPLSLAVIAIGLAVLAVVQGFALTFVAIVIIGLGISGVMANSDLVGAYLVDQDQATTGKNRAGAFISFFNMMYRVNGIFIGIAFWLVDDWYGFVSGKQLGNAPGEAAKFLFVYFPLVAILISFVFALWLRQEVREKK